MGLKLQQGHPILDAKQYRSINVEPGSSFSMQQQRGPEVDDEVIDLVVANPSHNTRSVEVFLSRGDVGPTIKDKDIRDLRDFLNSSIILVNRLILDRGREFSEAANLPDIDTHIRALKEEVNKLVKEVRTRQEEEDY